MSELASDAAEHLTADVNADSAANCLQLVVGLDVGNTFQREE